MSFFFGLLALIAQLTDFTWLYAAAVLVVVVYYATSVHWKWATVDQRVVFDDKRMRR